MYVDVYNSIFTHNKKLQSIYETLKLKSQRHCFKSDVFEDVKEEKNNSDAGGVNVTITILENGWQLLTGLNTYLPYTQQYPTRYYRK